MHFAVEDGKEKGSITVEASLVIPVIILSIAAVIYMGLLLYQRIVVQSAAETAAVSGAKAWASGVGKINTGRITVGSFDEIKLYRRIYDSGKNERIDAIKEYAAYLASRGELLKPSDTEIQVEIKDYAVCRKLDVSVAKSYAVPLGNFIKIFGGSGRIVIRAKGSSMLDEPAELIRTTDFILDLEKKLENSNPDAKNLGDKARNAMNDLKSRLEKFLE